MPTVALLMGMSACDKTYNGNFRYRLSFSVKLNGESKSGSSIIQMRYWGGKGGITTSAVTAFSDWDGVAPVIDIRPYGWLIAAMAPNSAHYERMHGPNPPSCKENVDASMLPGIFERTPAELTKMSDGRKRLPPALYPSFIWIPPNVSYLMAKPVCAEDFARVIGQHVALESVTIEVARDAPLLTLQPFKAAWLDEIRTEQRDSVIFGNSFKILRQHQLEKATIKSESVKP